LLTPDPPGLGERDPPCSAAVAACLVIEANAGTTTDRAEAEAVEPRVPVGPGQPAVAGRDLPAVLPAARVLGLK
jgi:hypothetical protein